MLNTRSGSCNVNSARHIFRRLRSGHAGDAPSVGHSSDLATPPTPPVDIDIKQTESSASRLQPANAANTSIAHVAFKSDTFTESSVRRIGAPHGPASKRVGNRS